MQWVAKIVQHALVHWGHLALAGALLGEDAGLPLPGETVLMLASFLAHKKSQLSLAIIILVASPPRCWETIAVSGSAGGWDRIFCAGSRIS